MGKVKQVSVAGLGTVGGEVVNRLRSTSDELAHKSGVELELGCVAEPEVPDNFEGKLEKVNLYDDVLEMLENENPDIFVELIGGVGVARKAIERALKSGLDVVTANKELLAKNGDEIFEVARNNGGRIRFEASVGGSMPVVRTIQESFVNAEFTEIYGIINGTANYVLSRMEEDEQEFSKALNLAQERGYAEADPTYDIEGDDSAHKLAIIAALAFGNRVPLENIYCEGITSIRPEIIEDARRLGYRIKLLGIAKKINGGLDIRVHPTMIPRDSALAAVCNEYNAVYFQGEPMGSSMLYGKGAGGPATSTAVIADVVDLAGGRKEAETPVYFSEVSLTQVPVEEVKTRYYIRLSAIDRPGVLAQVTRILGHWEISIETVIQRGRSGAAGEEVPVILTTHEAREGPLQTAIEEMTGLDVIGAQPEVIRIEEGFEGT